LYKEAGEWFVEKGVKCVGVDQQALDHPLGTAIGPHGPGPLIPEVNAEYKKETGRDVIEDFPHWEPCHKILLGNDIMGYENVGGDIDQVAGMRVTLVGFPIRWEKGDGSIVRLVAIVDSGDQ
jgi:kynurenine formamidase